MIHKIRYWLEKAFVWRVHPRSGKSYVIQEMFILDGPMILIPKGIKTRNIHFVTK